MNFKMIGLFLSGILALEALFMTPSLLLCIADDEPDVCVSFLITIGLILIISGILWLLCHKSKKGFYAREGMVCAGSCWIVMSLLGCMPFYLSGQIPHYIDALFEMVSGFTTTGSTILSDVEAMSRALLYWRSFSHWLGGMGVLVLLLAVSSAKKGSGGFTMHILRAESPGPNVGKLVPRMRQTAVVLYILYIVLTVLNYLFLIFGDMPWFDAMCTAFGTAGTGGFGVRNDSLAGYSPYLQNVTTVFMILFGINFSCYFLLVTKHLRSVLFDEEIRLYLGLILGSILLIVWNLKDYYASTGETVRHAAFQVASIISSSGFATTDFDLWPNFSKSILLCLMFIGACAGSTGGGFKCQRVLLLIKSLRCSIKQAIYPHKVQVLTINKQRVSDKVLVNTHYYLVAYVIFIFVSFILVSIDGFSITTNLSAVVSCFNNIGPGFETVGPTCNFAAYSTFSKLVLILDMLAGRLEIFPILIFFAPSTWHRK